ncbi:hypothetical protein J6590_022611 [Homalodisca vitripennis]|nr:hypothetical protein J6590_022611 [Homalodisca vitripennis]
MLENLSSRNQRLLSSEAERWSCRPAVVSPILTGVTRGTRRCGGVAVTCDPLTDLSHSWSLGSQVTLCCFFPGESRGVLHNYPHFRAGQRTVLRVFGV